MLNVLVLNWFFDPSIKSQWPIAGQREWGGTFRFGSKELGKRKPENCDDSGEKGGTQELQQRKLPSHVRIRASCAPLATSSI